MHGLGLALLIILVIALIVALVVRLRTEYSIVQSMMFVACCVLTRVLWRTKVVNAMPVPAGQGALIAANHRSSVDPFFVQITSRRVVHWMVAHEYFNIPVIGYLLKQTGAIATKRAGSDTAATREAIRLAKNGELVGVLPEGKINQTKDEFMLPVRPGAAMVAIRAGVPIVPCYIDGAPFNKKFWTPFLMPAKVRIEFGQPIHIPKDAGDENRRAVAEQVTLQLITELARLANRSDFQPKLRKGPTKATSE